MGFSAIGRLKVEIKSNARRLAARTPSTLPRASITRPLANFRRWFKLSPDFVHFLLHPVLSRSVCGECGQQYLSSLLRRHLIGALLHLLCQRRHLLLADFRQLQHCGA
jgi:hypothetical protein